MSIVNFSVGNDGDFLSSPQGNQAIEGALIRLIFPDQPLGLLRNKIWKLELNNLYPENFVTTQGTITTNDNIFDIQTINTFSISSVTGQFIIRIYSSNDEDAEPILTVNQPINLKGSANDIRIISDKTRLKEGESITFLIQTRDISDNAELPFRINGINNISDFEIEVNQSYRLPSGTQRTAASNIPLI